MRPLFACHAAALAGLLCGLAGCGGGGGQAGVLRVAGEEITEATVDHWTGIVRRGGGVLAGSRDELPGDARRRAVSFLIASRWLIGEAARRGLAVPAEAVDIALAEREREPGVARYRQRLAAKGQTLGDAKFEIRAELALAELRSYLESRASSVTRRDVADFYRMNRQLFREPEVRVVDFVETLPTRSAALALVKRVGVGRGFSEVGFRERVPRPLVVTGRPDKIQLVNGIFSARPGIASAPLHFYGAWTVFVVRKIIPPHGRPRPLAKVHDEARERLIWTRRNAIVAAFDREYRTRWTAETHCSTGYVIPACSRALKELAPYEDVFVQPAGVS